MLIGSYLFALHNVLKNSVLNHAMTRQDKKASSIFKQGSCYLSELLYADL